MMISALDLHVLLTVDFRVYIWETGMKRILVKCGNKELYFYNQL